MAEQVHNDNEKRENCRLEYEQLITTLLHFDVVELGINVFIIPLISWGLMLKGDGIFDLQEILIIGKISIGIWFIYLVCFIFIFVKAKRLLDRARDVWNLLNGCNKDKNTHISILRSLPASKLFNYSILFKLIGFAVCGLWIYKYPQIRVEICSLFGLLF